MKPIYILALHNVRTGGPEALHQLSDALIEQGFDARMVYYDWRQIAALEGIGPGEGYCFGVRESTIEEYACYRTNVVEHVPNDGGAIIVLPEPLCHLAPWFANQTALVWWLSVDNGFGALAKINLNQLRRSNVRHATQSAYAERFVHALGFPHAGMLSDYTVDLTEYATPLPMAERPKLACFNANRHKVDAAHVADAMRELKDIDPEIECAIVQGSRADVARLFARARVYVDLGSFPGKDRMPREAASMGCPSVGLVGCGAAVEAASYASLWPLTGESIHALMTETLPWMPHGVDGERVTFFSQVRDVFSAL